MKDRLTNLPSSLIKEQPSNKEAKKEVLSRDCDGCSQMTPCRRRYLIAIKGDKVYCPDGTAHLVDGM